MKPRSSQVLVLHIEREQAARALSSGFGSRGENKVKSLLLYSTRNTEPIFWLTICKLVALFLPWGFVKREMYFIAFLARIRQCVWVPQMALGLQERNWRHNEKQKIY